MPAADRYSRTCKRNPSDAGMKMLRPSPLTPLAAMPFTRINLASRWPIEQSKPQRYFLLYLQIVASRKK
jgi:hypothetical protein